MDIASARDSRKIILTRTYAILFSRLFLLSTINRSHTNRKMQHFQGVLVILSLPRTLACSLRGLMHHEDLKLWRKLKRKKGKIRLSKSPLIQLPIELIRLVKHFIQYPIACHRESYSVYRGLGPCSDCTLLDCEEQKQKSVAFRLHNQREYAKWLTERAERDTRHEENVALIKKMREDHIIWLKKMRLPIPITLVPPSLHLHDKVKPYKTGRKWSKTCRKRSGAKYFRDLDGFQFKLKPFPIVNTRRGGGSRARRLRVRVHERTLLEEERYMDGYVSDYDPLEELYSGSFDTYDSYW